MGSLGGASSVVPSLTASSVQRLWRDQCVFQQTEQTFLLSII